MNKSFQVSKTLLEAVYYAGTSSNEFATYHKTKFWDYEILKAWNSSLSSDVLLIVESKNNNLVGFLLGTILSNKIITIENIYVSPNERNSGVATSLIDSVKYNYSTCSNVFIRSLTQKNNKNALNMFLKSGFDKCETTKWLYIRNTQINLSKCNSEFPISFEQHFNEKIDFWPRISSGTGILGDIFIYQLNSNSDDYGKIVVSITPTIKKATIESIVCYESSVNLKDIELALVYLTEYLFNCGYSLVTIHPKLLCKDIIISALNAGFREGSSFVPVQKRL